jgi:hypothetical protein
VVVRRYVHGSGVSLFHSGPAVKLEIRSLLSTYTILFKVFFFFLSRRKEQQIKELKK